MSRTSHALVRAAAVASALTLVAVIAPAPAVGAAPGHKTDLNISFAFGPIVHASRYGVTPRVSVGYKNGHGEGQSRIVFDLKNLSKDITVELISQDLLFHLIDCTRADLLVTCDAFGDIQNYHFFRLRSTENAKPGPAGYVTATVKPAFEEVEETNWSDNKVTFGVRVPEPGPDLAAWIASDPYRTVGPGDKVSLHASVRNDGDEPIPAYTITYRMPRNIAISGYLEDGCVKSGKWAKNAPTDYAYGPNVVTCRITHTLLPGDEYVLIEGGSLYYAYSIRAGKNLPGPGEILGYLEAYTDVDTDRRNDIFEMRYPTKPNKLDLTIGTPKPVSGKVGDTVTVKYSVTNKGPSDGEGPQVDIVAPPGTVLLPTPGCRTKDSPDQRGEPESTALRCGTRDYFPATASGAGVRTGAVRLKIVSTPSGTGSITVANLGVSAESNPANNTAPFTVTIDNGGDPTNGGGAGGGLPITGASVRAIAGLGAAAIVVGVTLLLIARRRRTTG